MKITNDERTYLTCFVSFYLSSMNPSFCSISAMLPFWALCEIQAKMNCASNIQKPLGFNGFNGFNVFVVLSL